MSFLIKLRALSSKNFKKGSKAHNMGDNGSSSDDDEVKDKGNVSSSNCMSVPDQEIMDLKIKELISGGRNDESSPVSKKREHESDSQFLKLERQDLA